MRKIDYDFSRLKVDGNLGIGLAIRAKTLDVHVQDRFVEDISAYKPEHAARMSRVAKLFVRLWKYISALRKIGRLLRYRL
ncbi:hypothetical protein AJ88_14415 [Mesorhizobium amorphae CCBAU 01583]|nr:hypothetical protein AJ88_14415 [Mesorhizobium amorphae CCBAU 01583]